jgi:putative glycosyltransferase (TIGR04372 family)
MMGRIMLFSARLAWRVLIRVATILALPVSAMVWLMHLLRYASDIRRSDVVVLMTNPPAFAHTIVGPDVARRMFKGRRCLFLVTFWKFGFNPLVSEIWPDINVRFIRRFVLAVQFRHRVTSIPFAQLHDRMAQWVTRKVVWLLGHKDGCFFSLEELYEELLSQEGLAGNVTADKSGWSPPMRLAAAQINLQKRVSVPNIHLPKQMRSEIYGELARIWRSSGNNEKAKYCCLYLRYEKKDSYTTRLRNTSNLKNHLPAVSLLNRQGYQVLLTGDIDLDAETRRAYDGRLVDADSLSIEDGVFNLFAALEVDIFIGNNGGGVCLPNINDIPVLFLDAFPFNFGYKNSFVYFKSARDKKGRVIPGLRLLSDFAADITATFGTLENNSADEITEAVGSFLEDLKELNGPDPHADIAEMIPDNSLFRITGAKVSPAWVRHNVVVTDEMAS